jgi:hypothetical protein
MVLGDKAVPAPMPSTRDNWLTRCIALMVFCLCAAGVYVMVGLGHTGSY